MAADNGLPSVQHIVVLMLENRSFDHMLGFLYTDQGNVSPAGQPYAGLTGTESNPDPSGQPVTVFRIGPATPNAYFMPGADPGEGYKATNSQLFGSIDGPGSPADVPGCQGFVRDFAYTLGWPPLVPHPRPGFLRTCRWCRPTWSPGSTRPAATMPRTCCRPSAPALRTTGTSAPTPGPREAEPLP